ncbi:hypothetical protein [Euzebya sp.]|uniref:hypothetical protein n=1 Tax=Euzebya sp. TaxID=1971409 RepID=UPI003515FA40
MIGVVVLFGVMAMYRPGSGSDVEVGVASEGPVDVDEEPTPDRTAAAPEPPAAVTTATPPGTDAPATATPAPSDTATASVAGSRRAVVLGDRYAVGPDGEEGYATDLSELTGWDVVDAGGTGAYVDPSGDAFAAAAEAAILETDPPGLMVIAGGADDADAIAAVRPAADELFDTILLTSRDTQLVVVGPIWHEGSPPAEVLAVRDSIEAAARRRNIPFIDPLAEQWITGTGTVAAPAGDGNADRSVSADGTGLTAAGQAYLAERVTARLRVLGLAEPPGAPAS